MNGNLKGGSGTSGLKELAAQAVILDAALLHEASVPHSWGLCSSQRRFVRHRKTMVTCDSISSYLLRKLGSSSASTCVWELRKEPQERCHGHVPSSGMASGDAWSGKHSLLGFLGGLKAKVELYVSLSRRFLWLC